MVLVDADRAPGYPNGWAMRRRTSRPPTGVSARSDLLDPDLPPDVDDGICPLYGGTGGGLR
ncbi:hypothetical protein AB0L22_28075 [Micromonospora haikouensis]|uniref:hypothetical protein n=1 Tax=Micromonospora haikouensis TaxID=686309 RepID=UPI0034387FA0